MVKIRFKGNKPFWYRTLGGSRIAFQPNGTAEVNDSEEVARLLQENYFVLADGGVGKTDTVPQPKTLSRPTPTIENKVDEKEEAPEEQKPEKKEKVLKAKPKAKKPKLKKDKLRKKLQSKRTKK
tara:strand:+ start:689 stop:1060 length:372 start_codon:yes stop_codon:yes gene_type:complete